MVKVKSAAYDKNLEGLRGICALSVVIAHLFGFSFFQTKGDIWVPVIMHMQFGGIAVLIFFIVSGYVMGISHINSPFNFTNAKEYLKKRLVRLYPIYLFALFLCIVFGNGLISFKQLIGHLFFLQEFFVNTIQINVSLWSLSFEWVYYLLFIGLWAINSRSKLYYVFISIVVVCVSLICNDDSSFRSLFIGWIFWLSGLYISRLAKNGDQINATLRPLISYLFILLSTRDLQTGGFFLRLFHLLFISHGRVTLEDLIYIPICTLLVLTVTQRHCKLEFLLQLVAYLLPALNILALFYFKHDIKTQEDWVYGVSFFLLSIFFLPFKINNGNIGSLAYIGKISFAIYVFHFPLFYFLNLALGRVLSGLIFTLTGILLSLIITFCLAYLAENIIQPKIRKIFLNPKT